MDTLFRLFCQHLRTISFHARNLFSSIRYSDSKPQLQNKDHTHRPTLDTDTGGDRPHHPQATCQQQHVFDNLEESVLVGSTHARNLEVEIGGVSRGEGE